MFIMLGIIALFFLCLIVLFVFVRLDDDYRQIREGFKAGCDRASRREETMHPWGKQS
ncbi:MAG: hypothetical protein ACRD19_00025 [Terriglobia bacterium]